MKVKWLLRAYRASLLVTVVVSYGIAAVAILIALWAAPHIVLYLLDVLAPVTAAVKNFLWTFFPEAEWLRRAGEWMGRGARWALSRSGARTQAIARLALLDGPILLTVTAWASGTLLRLWSSIMIARWFDRRYVIVRRPKSARTPPQQRVEPRLPMPPQLKLPRDDHI